MFNVALLLGILITQALPQPSSWQTLEPGIELASLTARTPSSMGDSRITVVRIDPAKWELRLVARSQSDDSECQTARQWAKRHGLVVAVNAGMFGTDYTTHIGYMESRGHVNSAAVNSYQSGSSGYRVGNIALVMTA